MKMIPVLDILDGVAVRALGGVRNEYQPLKSQWSETSDPLEIALGIREQFGFNQWYLADLDGIVHAQWNTELIEKMSQEGFSLQLDLGVRSLEDMCRLGVHFQSNRCILSTESLADSTALDSLTGMLDPGQITFSLDLVQGKILRPQGAWGDLSPLDVVQAISERGIQELIVLDLAYIGCTNGIGTLELCCQIKKSFPDLVLHTGGGVRTTEQIAQLESHSVDALLLGTAIHSGELTPEQLSQFQTT